MSETGEQSKPQLYKQANKLIEAGNKKDAIPLFEQAGHTALAVKNCEEEGDPLEAYQIAMRGNDHYLADRLATKYHISGHEYFNFLPTMGRNYFDVMAGALESRLAVGATAEKLGFHGFQGKVVADIGTRDGRFIPMLNKLGAKDVYGIDPNVAELEKAIQSNLINKEHAIPSFLQDIPDHLKGTFEVATIFNFNMPKDEYSNFFDSLSTSLTPKGEVIITVAEKEIADAIMSELREHFNIQSTRLWDGVNDMSHAYLIVGTKKAINIKN